MYDDACPKLAAPVEMHGSRQSYGNLRVAAGKNECSCQTLPEQEPTKTL